MNRFRAWDKEDKAYTTNKYLFEIVPDGVFFDLVPAIDPDDSNGLIIEQYTGKDDDVKGEPIYEGSIVEKRHIDSETGLPFGETLVGTIVYDPSFARYLLDVPSLGKRLSIYTEFSQYKVIGDIHCNADLLEDDK